MRYVPPPKSQKCNDCIRSIGGCSWTSKWIPVEGWDAEKFPVKWGTKTDTYRIRDCPLYEKEPPKTHDQILRMHELGIYVLPYLLEK